MSFERIPGESSRPIGGIQTSILKKAFQGVTLDLMNREQYPLKGMSQSEISMLYKSIQRDSKCSNCNRPKDPDCDLCNGSYSF